MSEQAQIHVPKKIREQIKEHHPGMRIVRFVEGDLYLPDQPPDEVFVVASEMGGWLALKPIKEDSGGKP